MGMGLSVTLNPNGVGLQTALNAPLLGRDNLPVATPNVLGGFVSAMGSMQGGTGMGAMIGSPGLGGLGIVGFTGTGVGVNIMPSSNTTSTSAVNSISGEVSIIDTKSNSTLALPSFGGQSLTETVCSVSNNLLPEVKSLVAAENNESRNMCSPKESIQRDDNVCNRVQAVSVGNNGTVQGLTVRNNNTSPNTLASSVILGVGVVPDENYIEYRLDSRGSTSRSPSQSQQRTNSACGHDTVAINSRRSSGVNCRREANTTVGIDEEVRNIIAPKVNRRDSNSKQCNTTAFKLSVQTDTEQSSVEDCQKNFQDPNQNPEVESPCSENSEESLVPIIV